MKSRAGFSAVQRVIALFALLELACRSAAESFPNLYATSSCTLLKDLNGVCQLKSMLGANSSTTSSNGLFMNLGEINCTLTLKQCHSGTCYSLRDLTSLVPPPPDVGVVLTTGWFSAFQIVSGASGLSWTREGIAFRATGTEVVVRYSTQLCGDYWRVRGQVGQQFCNFPIEAITVVDTDTPISLSCS